MKQIFYRILDKKKFKKIWKKLKKLEKKCMRNFENRPNDWNCELLRFYPRIEVFLRENEIEYGSISGCNLHAIDFWVQFACKREKWKPEVSSNDRARKSAHARTSARN